MKALQIGKWNQTLQNELYYRDETTSYVDSIDHDGPVFKFPAGRPVVGDLVVCMARWDATMRRGENDHRPCVRRVVTVKPADAREGKEYADLRICSPKSPDGAGELFLGAHLSLSRNPVAEQEQ